MKADKGNSIVILTNDEYDERMHQLIRDSDFEQLKKSPLDEINKLVRSELQRLHELGVIDHKTRYKLIVSNPVLPRLYGLPKIHKPGNKMRPIVSNVNAPTYKLAKWLVSEFQKIGEPKGFQVKNSEDAARRVNGLLLNDDDVMLSFDVVSLFPNIPMDYAIQFLEEHLLKKGIRGEQLSTLINLTELCMYKNQFTFRDKFYKLKDGCAMGNPLSPYIANVFLAKFENDFSNHALFPKFWMRYVDDVFAVVKRQKIRQVLNHINNSKFKSLKFTLETELDGQIPFLDLLVTRRDNKVSLGIYHKPTSTLRYIPSTSNHPIQHKKAAFNSMIHRLTNIPLSTENYETEKQHIYEAAKLNGYESSMIDQTIRKFKRKQHIKQCSSLTPIEEEKVTKKRIVLPYHVATKEICRILSKSGFETAFESGLSLQKHLGSTKDVIPTMEKSGIYKITCPDCGECYIGQTKRRFIDRLKEHERECKKLQALSYNSAVAEHTHDKKHYFNVLDNTEILKVVTNVYQLDAWESYQIFKCCAVINRDEGPLSSGLFKCV